VDCSKRLQLGRVTANAGGSVSGGACCQTTSPLFGRALGGETRDLCLTGRSERGRCLRGVSHSPPVERGLKAELGAHLSGVKVGGLLFVDRVGGLLFVDRYGGRYVGGYCT